MKQEGFSLVFILALVAAIASIGVAGYVVSTQGVGGGVDNDKSDQTSEVTGSSTSQTPDKKAGGKTKLAAKTRIDACSLISLEKISSITGVEMTYVDAPTLGSDEELWTSTCSFTEKAAKIESNVGVVLIITEGLNSGTKAELRQMFDDIKKDDNGVSVSGFGDKAFKTGASTDEYRNYYVMVGDIMVWAYAAVAYGEILEGGMADLVAIEDKDDVTEAMLKYILPQID